MTVTPAIREVSEREVQIRTGSILLNGELEVPDSATGIVLFAHGSGSSRHSPRNQYWGKGSGLSFLEAVAPTWQVQL